MGDSIPDTMYALVADKFLIRTRDRLPQGGITTLLDIGTGTGHPAVEPAVRFADRSVIPMDIFPGPYPCLSRPKVRRDPASPALPLFPLTPRID